LEQSDAIISASQQVTESNQETAEIAAPVAAPVEKVVLNGVADFGGVR
jgi:hypothetical protein